MVVGLLLKVGSTGVVFQTADQVAIASLGAVIAGFVCLFARPRLRIGPAGVAVRNLFGYRLFPWSDVRGCRSIPARGGRGWTCPTTSTFR